MCVPTLREGIAPSLTIFINVGRETPSIAAAVDVVTSRGVAITVTDEPDATACRTCCRSLPSSGGRGCGALLP